MTGIAAEKPLYPAKIRVYVTAVSLFLLFCGLYCLVCFNKNSVKIPAAYVFTACAMHVIVLYKNSLNKYEVGIFFFLCVQLMAMAPKPDNLESIVGTSYLLSYRYGVSSRGFAATIVDFLSNNSFISKHFVWHFIFCSSVFLNFLISVYLGCVIKKSEAALNTFLTLLSLLCLWSFASPAAYFSESNFGRVEIFALIFMLFVIAVINKKYAQWLIPFFALCIMSAHLILVFFYIPALFIILLHKLLSSKDNKHCLIVFFSTFVVVAAGFILYLLFHKHTFAFPNAAAFADYLKQKTDLAFTEHFLFMTLFADFQNHLQGWRDAVSLNYSGNISVLVNLPLVLMFIYFWTQCFFQEKERRLKLFFIFPVLLLIYHIPVFFMFYDFGRWMVMIVLIQFILVFYLIYTQNDTALTVITKLVPLINKYRYVILYICSLTLFLGPVDTMGPSERIRHILRGFSGLF